MDVVPSRCAGIDISKRDATVCVRIAGAGRRKAAETVSTWRSVTRQILALRDHLLAEQVTCVVAGTDLLINHGCWLHRHDFTGRFIRTGTSITDPATPMAGIDWTTAITALNTGDLPCSGSEQRILRLAASIAGGIPVNLREALTELDHRNIKLVITAILHTSGHRPPPRIP